MPKSNAVKLMADGKILRADGCEYALADDGSGGDMRFMTRLARVGGEWEDCSGIPSNPDLVWVIVTGEMLREEEIDRERQDREKAQLATIGRLLSLLRSMEWVVRYGGISPRKGQSSPPVECCPSCGAERADGHLGDCKLAAELRYKA